MTVTEMQRRIQNAKDLDFGNIFNQSMELFKKVWVQGLVTLLLNFVLVIPVIMVVYIPFIFIGIADMYISSYNAYDPYVQPDFSPVMIIVMLVAYLFMVIAMSAIAFGLKAAFYRICKMRDLEQMGREDYFHFFKKPYLGKTIKLGVAFTCIIILATLLCVVPVIYAIVPLSLMMVVYAFNPDMPTSEIIKLSFELGNKKWMLSFGLMFVSGLLAGIVGMLMCGFGVYVTASFGYLPSYFIYKEVIGFDDENKMMQIEEEVIF